MLNNTLIQIALALLFVFLVMAAVVSLVQQFIVQGFRLRARNLRGSITKLLSDDVYTDQIAKRFYRHPMTMALSGGRSEPTELDEDTFVLALASAVQPAWSTGDAVESLPASVNALKDGPLRQRLMLVMPPAGANREVITNNVKAWFRSTTNKMSERFKADCIALSYGVAVVATLLLNVSAIEIVNRLRSDDQMRAAFASVAPDLATRVYAASSSPEAAAASPPTVANAVAGSNTAPTSATEAQMPALDVQQAGQMWTVFQCAKGRSDIPVGWGWMADVVSRIDAKQERNDPCNDAIESAASDPALQQRLVKFQDRLPQAVAGAAKQEHLYGPTFERNGVWEVLLGWLITIVAAAQGAPFWFNALRKVAGR